MGNILVSKTYRKIDMIAFIVPFRCKASSKNWEFHSALLNRTLQSITNQTNSNFKVIVVYTDFPENKYESNSVTWLHFPFPFLKVKEITDYELHAKQYFIKEEYAEFSMDQGRKSIYGADVARKSGYDYVMSVDADDLVSNKIVQFVEDENQNNNNPGWYVNKGYVYIENKNLLFRYPRNLNHFCGSSYIVRQDLIFIPSFESRNMLEYSFFSGHAWLLNRLKEYNKVVLQPLPFYGIIYILNSVSWMNSGSTFLSNGLKKWAKIFLYGQISYARIKKEFSLFRIQKKIVDSRPALLSMDQGENF
jgi:hypothetical protein